VLALCFTEAALAQSGRNRRERVVPPTPVNAEPQAEPTVEPQATKAPVPITSVIVGGYVVHDSIYMRNNYVDIAVKACIERFKEGPMLTTQKGGKLTRKAAVEWAKKETSAYILWLEIKVEHIGMSGERTIPYIKYFVFMPQTAEVLVEGQVDPNNQTVRINGARIPTVNRGSLDPTLQLDLGGQMVADRVRRHLHY
jgi:hypothetical protein